MQSKSAFKKLLLIAHIFGVIFFSMITLLLSFALLMNGSPVNGLASKNMVGNRLIKPVVQNTTFLKQESYGLPVRLKIPKIKVDVTLERVGLTLQGAVDIPKGPFNAAWFNKSPYPGDIGTAIITGHYGIWKSGKQTVFNNLYKLRKGDKVYIKDEKGDTVSFVVRESKIYNPEADVPEVFGVNDGKAHLNLITCEGIWNKISKNYSKRRVVFADKE